jgi:hypothetical protein
MEQAITYVRHIGGFTVSGTPDTRYADFIPTGNPIQLGRDDGERYIWVASFYAIREEVS